MEVEKQAEKVLKELSKALGDIDLQETYYVVDEINVTRKDGRPKVEEGFRERILRIAPKVDEDGNIVTEVGEWVE
jgi:predicted Asp-tRNA(Asn)/Glu-tRNA(Gln) amidotransferase subunit C